MLLFFFYFDISAQTWLKRWFHFLQRCHKAGVWLSFQNSALEKLKAGEKQENKSIKQTVKTRLTKQQDSQAIHGKQNGAWTLVLKQCTAAIWKGRHLLPTEKIGWARCFKFLPCWPCSFRQNSKSIDYIICISILEVILVHFKSLVGGRY